MFDCGTELGDFDEKQNKYLQLSGTLHTRERCESLKNRSQSKVEQTNLEQESFEQATLQLVFDKLKVVDAKLDKVLTGGNRK
jgi:hypothetical protein